MLLQICYKVTEIPLLLNVITLCNLQSQWFIKIPAVADLMFSIFVFISRSIENTGMFVSGFRKVLSPFALCSSRC